MELSTYEENLLHMQPALIYMHMARAVIDDFGIDGESAVRKGLVEFAVARGSHLRKQHMALGMKTNLKNHFYYNTNPYQDLTFEEQMDHVTEQEDVRKTTYCPTMSTLIEYGERQLAIMYCEEVHPPLWQSYAPTAIVNLGKTLSQEGSDCCMFDVFLRPGRMTPEQRKECFEEYDPDFKGDRRDEFVFLTQRQAASMKGVMMVSGIYKAVTACFGEKALASLQRGVRNFVSDVTEKLTDYAKTQNETMDRDLLERALFVSRNIEDDENWDIFSDKEVKEFAKINLYDEIEKVIEKQ